MLNLIAQPSINILDEKLRAPKRTKPTDKVLWTSCYVITVDGQTFIRSLQGTYRRKTYKPTKLERKAEKKRTHLKRYYYGKVIFDKIFPGGFANEP